MIKEQHIRKIQTVSGANLVSIPKPIYDKFKDQYEEVENVVWLVDENDKIEVRVKKNEKD